MIGCWHGNELLAFHLIEHEFESILTDLDSLYVLLLHWLDDKDLRQTPKHSGGLFDQEDQEENAQWSEDQREVKMIS